MFTRATSAGVDVAAFDERSVFDLTGVDLRGEEREHPGGAVVLVVALAASALFASSPAYADTASFPNTVTSEGPLILA